MKQLEKLAVAVIDDESISQKQICRLLSRNGYQVEGFENPLIFLERMDVNPFHIVLTDIRMPQLDGVALLTKVKSRFPETEVILFTGFSSIEEAVSAIKNGAFDYIEKPIKPERILATIKRAADKLFLVSENKMLRQELLKKDHTRHIQGVSAHIRELIKIVNKVSRVDCNVLITGESGTGKEVVAKAIHYGSQRKDNPFLGFNCGGFTEELVANELFGHEKGAYTGAGNVKKGLFETGGGGTVFLDEIGEMSLSMQVKLLRVIQERQLFRLGGTDPVPLDIRLISATNRDLDHDVRTGRFREDLYFRLKVVVIRTAPLRERNGDIPFFAQHFVEKYNRMYNKQIEGFSRSAMDILLHYSFPGNVRELEHLVCSAVAMGEKSWIGPDDLPEDLNLLEISTMSVNGLPSLADQEKAHIVRVLEATNYNKVRSAKILNIPRTSLWRKIKRFGIEDIKEV
jgi:two-component system, NtrC family, response regulator AtoC